MSIADVLGMFNKSKAKVKSFKGKTIGPAAGGSSDGSGSANPQYHRPANLQVGVSTQAPDDRLLQGSGADKSGSVRVAKSKSGPDLKVKPLSNVGDVMVKGRKSK